MARFPIVESYRGIFPRFSLTGPPPPPPPEPAAPECIYCEPMAPVNEAAPTSR